MFGKKNWIVLVMSTLLFTACASTDKSADAENAWGTGYSKQFLASLGITKNPLEYKTLYFEYDSSRLDIRSEIIAAAHARDLSTKSGVNVVLEGHADERGSREYNLALGERRSSSVQNLMQATGVGSNAVSAVSYGEERPVALGSDDASWEQNRRVQILY